MRAMQTGTEQKKSTLPPEKGIERVIDLIDRKDLVAAQQEIEGVKGHILRIERDLAKERAEAERVKADLAQALDENRKLKEVIASYDGATAKEREEHLWEN